MIIDMLRTVIKEIEHKEVNHINVIRLNTVQHLLLNLFAKAKVDELPQLVPGRIHQDEKGDESSTYFWQARSIINYACSKGYSLKESCCKRLRAGSHNREKAS